MVAHLRQVEIMSLRWRTDWFRYSVANILTVGARLGLTQQEKTLSLSLPHHATAMSLLNTSLQDQVMADALTTKEKELAIMIPSFANMDAAWLRFIVLAIV